MKYTIEKLNLDNYVLKYKDKEIKFNSKVDYMSKMQNVAKDARFKMIKDLKEQGLTIKSLIVEEKKDGKIYQDNSNKDFIEKGYITEEQNAVFNKVIKEMMGKDLQELVVDIGFETEEEVIEFSTQLGEVLGGRFQGAKDQK